MTEDKIIEILNYFEDRDYIPYANDICEALKELLNLKKRIVACINTKCVNRNVLLWREDCENFIRQEICSDILHELGNKILDFAKEDIPNNDFITYCGVLRVIMPEGES